MLQYLFFGVALMATAGLYIGVPTLSLWWSLPIAIGMYAAAVILFFVYLLFTLPFLPSKKKSIQKPLAYCRFMVWLTMDWLMKLFRIRITVKGQEKLPDAPCVIIGNHLSGYDPMTLLAAFRNRNTVFISKPSNFKIPIVGRYIHGAGFVSIDRENGVRAVRTLHNAADTMKNTGVDVVLYPEGTRSKTGKLLRFKTGAFLLAQEADVPIAVLAFSGTERVSKNLPFRKTEVTIEVLEVVEREDVQKAALNDLADRTRTTVAQYFAGKGVYIDEV